MPRTSPESGASVVALSDVGVATDMTVLEFCVGMALARRGSLTAREIAGKNPHAIRAAKRLFDLAQDGTTAELLLAESVEQKALLGSPNQMESVMSNMQKRPANYRDPA